MNILTSVWSAQHPNPGQNIQQWQKKRTTQDSSVYITPLSENSVPRLWIPVVFYKTQLKQFADCGENKFKMVNAQLTFKYFLKIAPSNSDFNLKSLSLSLSLSLSFALSSHRSCYLPSGDLVARLTLMVSATYKFFYISFFFELI